MFTSTKKQHFLRLSGSTNSNTNLFPFFWFYKKNCTMTTDSQHTHQCSIFYQPALLNHCQIAKVLVRKSQWSQASARNKIDSWNIFNIFRSQTAMIDFLVRWKNLHPVKAIVCDLIWSAKIKFSTKTLISQNHVSFMPIILWTSMHHPSYGIFFKTSSG